MKKLERRWMEQKEALTNISMIEGSVHTAFFAGAMAFALCQFEILHDVKEGGDKEKLSEELFGELSGFAEYIESLIPEGFPR